MTATERHPPDKKLSLGLVRAELERRFLENQARTEWLFDLIEPDAYLMRPIALRNPIVFYEGHLAAFAVNTLIRGALRRPPIDEHFERLFARGIDPEDEKAVTASGISAWPSRDSVRNYVGRAHEALLDAIRNAEIDTPGDPLRRNAASAWTVVDHDPMHHETLLYMWHQLPYELKRGSSGAGAAPSPSSAVAAKGGKRSVIRIPAGRTTVGTDTNARFGWDNEFPAHLVDVPPFEIDVHNVTNGEFLEFVGSGGYQDSQFWNDDDWSWKEAGGIEHPHFWRRRDREWVWRGMFEEIPLPGIWPVYVSQAEATAYARWAGRRLPTEAEYHRAAFGVPDGEDRSFPWGEKTPSPEHGNFNFRSFDPSPVGSFPSGASHWGIHDLAGNGWEWTSTIFSGFDGFTPMAPYPQYSADFFDGKHFVLKGGSPATSSHLIRRGFRNWFRPNYPYLYATFRTVKSLDE